VTFVSPQLIVYGSWTFPYGVERIHADCLWDNNHDKAVDSGSNAGQSVRIAVIDSGIDAYVDENGHGTHVMGTIAAVGNDGRRRWRGPENTNILTKIRYRSGR
jgi:subtilisin family serine protease